jgi:WD40 repeat protein
METNLRRERWFAFVCICLSLASVKTNAAETAQLGDLRGVSQAHFNHDASRLIVLTRSGEIGLWDTKQGALITGDPALKEPSETYLMSPDASRLLVGFKDGRARIFDASSGTAISPVLEQTLRDNGQNHPQAVFSPDGNTVVLFGEKKATVLEVKTGKSIASLPVAFQIEEGSDSTALAIFSSDGAKCFVMDPKGTVTAYETKKWTAAGKTMKHPPAKQAYQFGFSASSDGKWIVTFDDPGENGPQGQLQAWDALTSKPLGKPLSAVNGMSGRFLVGQNRVLVESGRGEATVRNLPSMETSYVIKQHDEIDGPNVELFPNGKWLVAWGPDQKIDLIDAATGKILNTHSSPVGVTGVMVPLDSSTCYVGLENTTVATADVRYDNSLQRFSVPELQIAGAISIPDFLLRPSLSRDGRWLLTVQGATDDERIVIYDAAAMKPVEWPKP